MSLYPVLCCLAAFAALCLALERHHEAALALPLSPRRQRLLRGLALAGFLLSALGVWPRADYGIAWAGWVAQLSLAGLAVVALATWWPRGLLPTAVLSAVGALLWLALP